MTPSKSFSPVTQVGTKKFNETVPVTQVGTKKFDQQMLRKLVKP